MTRKVYIVHCIDTEGPLYESPNIPFERLENIFNIKIEPTKENLLKLQNGEIKLKGMEEAVRNLLDPHKLATKGSWNEINDMLQTITSNEFREKVTDSNGKGWVYSWFCMDHVGFTGNNPRRRDSGHHKIFDRYMQLVNDSNYGDIVQFHHHPVPISGNYNDSGTAFWGKSTLNDILTRKVIDRQWFPSAFRPGFHTERPDSHWFLEQWIPFDYGNQAVKGMDTNQPDLMDGRFGDWRHSVKDWRPYHPSHDNYQVEGNCRRWIARCLNMCARSREITELDIEDAFKQASHGKKALLAFTDHDYKDMEYEVNRIRNMIDNVSRKYTDVKFEYANAIEGMQKYLGINAKPINLTIKLIEQKGYKVLLVKVENEIFGPQPYLSIKTKESNYYWDNFDCYTQNEWTYTFDDNTIPYNQLEKIGVASNNKEGVTEVIVLDVETNEEIKKIYNL